MPKSNPPFVSYRPAKRARWLRGFKIMESAFTITGIIGGLLLGLGGYLISFGGHKIPSIWIMFSGAVLLCLSGALYLHAHAKTQSVTEAGAAVATTTPIPYSEPKPETSSLTSEHIFSQIEKAPDGKEKVARIFVGALVKWNLLLFSKKTEDGHELSLTFHPKYDPFKRIAARVPLEGNEFLRESVTGDEFIVSGKISSQVDADVILLKEASVKPVKKDLDVFTSPSPWEIVKQISAAEPIRREDIGNSFKGAKVRWLVSLYSVEISLRDGQVDVMLQDASSPDAWASVMISISKTERNNLRLSKQGDKFVVTGVISKAISAGFMLEDAILTPYVSSK